MLIRSKFIATCDDMAAFGMRPRASELAVILERWIELRRK